MQLVGYFGPVLDTSHGKIAEIGGHFGGHGAKNDRFCKHFESFSEKTETRKPLIHKGLRVWCR